MIIGASVHIGDILFQLVSFVLMFGVVVGILFIIVNFKKRSSRLDRLEQKVDQLLERKESKSD